MPQFDAYPNPNIAQREAFPYLVVLQSDQLDHHSTRLVMPLQRLPRKPVNAPRRLAQEVSVRGESLFMAPHLCGAFPVKLLRGRPVSLREQAGTLRDALDAVVSGV